MDGNKFDSDALPPMPPPQVLPPPQVAPPPSPGPTNQPQVIQQPWAAPVNAAYSRPRSRSKLPIVLVGLAVLSVASVVIVVVAVVVASSVGLFDSDQTDSNASSQLDQPEATAGAGSEVESGSEEPTAVVPTTPDGVTITWDARPSSCDGNNKRSFSANIGNIAPRALEVRVRVLDSANNFVHQSHVYTVPGSDQVRVDLGGIPSGQSIVQIVNESNGSAIGQTGMTFENC